MVLRLQLPNANLWRTRCLWRQLCQYPICFLENLLHSHRGIDHDHWAYRGDVSARFASESQEIYRRGESCCIDEGQRQSEVCSRWFRRARKYTDVDQAGLRTLASRETKS